MDRARADESDYKQVVLDLKLRFSYYRVIFFYLLATWFPSAGLFSRSFLFRLPMIGAGQPGGLHH